MEAGSEMTPISDTSVAAAELKLHFDPESIPPFPVTALKALKVVSGTDSSLVELCDLIRCDPAFSTAVLRLANSPLVAFPKHVTSVLQASMVLGFRRLRRVVFTLGLRNYLQVSFTPLMKLCWRHSIACAVLAERGAKCSLQDADFAYVAGILHDIGRVALAATMPEAYNRVLERGADDPQQLLETEREFCGIDHCQAGRLLIATWNLPEEFAEIAVSHHIPHVHLPGTASLLSPSCALADSLGFTVVPYRSARTYEEILAEFPEAARKGFPPDAKDLAATIATEIKVVESA
ncbi:MAG: HDOD domain-containing protein [Terriglobales bacterium]